MRKCNSEFFPLARNLAATTAAQGRYSMNRHVNLQRVVLLGLVLSFAGGLLAQRVPGKKLVVNGKTTGATVLQIDGRSYVDIENLAQITNGLVTFDPNQIVLTIPNSNSDAPCPQTTPGLSKDFASAAIAALAEMKEWKGALGTMVTFGLAVGGTWAQTYHDRVETSLAQATVAASTNSDHNALQLLSNQFANLTKWASDVFAERHALNGARTVDPNALQNDSALTKISNCGKFLSTMLGSGVFVDNASCD
jgi:hypothetical protein